MYYVTNPDEVVTNIQALTDDSVEGPRTTIENSETLNLEESKSNEMSSE